MQHNIFVKLWCIQWKEKHESVFTVTFCQFNSNFYKLHMKSSSLFCHLRCFMWTTFERRGKDFLLKISIIIESIIGMLTPLQISVLPLFVSYMNVTALSSVFLSVLLTFDDIHFLFLSSIPLPYYFVFFFLCHLKVETCANQTLLLEE